jgi:hypothetical protein
MAEPGALVCRVHAPGQNYVILNPDVLSNPRPRCQLTYRFEVHRIGIEKQPGAAWMEIAAGYIGSRWGRWTLMK